MDRGSWWATVHGVSKSQYWASNTFTFISKAIKWSKESFFKLGKVDIHMKSNEFRNRPYTFHKKLTQNGGFSGVPVVKTSLSNTSGVDSIPGQGAKSPHVAAVVQLCPTLCNPKSCSKSGFHVLHWLSQNLLKLLCIKLLMPANHFILCCPLFLLPSSIFPSIRVFSNESCQVAKVLELQFQHQSFKWTCRTDFL